jgi:hypothetical protein
MKYKELVVDVYQDMATRALHRDECHPAVNPKPFGWHGCFTMLRCGVLMEPTPEEVRANSSPI